MVDSQNKRKFDDRGSGVSYNRVPPPLSDFEVAKQRAEQIAARLVAQDAKKSRFDDRGTPEPSNVDAKDSSYNEQSPRRLFQNIVQAQPRSEGSSGSYHSMYGTPESRKVEIPNAKVGLVIGKGGETIKYIQQQSGARIQITRDMDHNPSVPFRTVELMGTPEQINRADQLIQDVITEADAIAANSSYGAQNSGEQIHMNVPTNKVGLIIGRGGETIKSLQSKTGARIQLVQTQGPSDFNSGGPAERVITLAGTKQQIDAASELIKELISENRTRTPPMQGSFNQGYRPPGPPQWVPPGGPPVQQQGYGYQTQSYGYQQQGPYYSGPPQQYGTYPQQPTSGWQPPPPPPPQPYQPYGYYTEHEQTGYNQPEPESYEQQALYAEQPPGTSQEGYGQQVHSQENSGHHAEAYGQTGSEYENYGPPGLAPPYVTSPYMQQGPSYQGYQGYGPPGVTHSAYGQQGPGQPDYGQHAINDQRYTQPGQETSNSEQQEPKVQGQEQRSSEHNVYDHEESDGPKYQNQDSTHLEHGQQKGLEVHAQQVMSHQAYTDPGLDAQAYGNDSSVQGNFNDYSSNHSSYLQQGVGQLGSGQSIGQQQGQMYGMQYTGEQGLAQFQQQSYQGNSHSEASEQQGNQSTSGQPSNHHSIEEQYADGNGYTYNGYYGSTQHQVQSADTIDEKGSDGQERTRNTASRES